MKIFYCNIIIQRTTAIWRWNLSSRTFPRMKYSVPKIFRCYYNWIDMYLMLKENVNVLQTNQLIGNKILKFSKTHWKNDNMKKTEINCHKQYIKSSTIWFILFSITNIEILLGYHTVPYRNWYNDFYIPLLTMYYWSMLPHCPDLKNNTQRKRWTISILIF